MDKRKRRLLCMLEGGKKYRWIRGVPPLSFKALAAGALENYRIYGNTVGGESVGDLVESGEHAGEYKVPVTVEGKNLLPYTVTSQTIAGVTFTVNGDGSVTCNGTSTSQYYSLFRIPCYLVAGNYTISGCPVGGGSRKYRADIRISPNGEMVGGDADTGAGVTIPIDESGWYDYTIRIQGGYTVDDVAFKPMIRKADIEDDTYEPYHAPVTTPIYLPEPIKMVGDEAEYVDYAEQKMHRIGADDVDVTLPALPTLTGTNVLSVGTAVQPSKIEVKGKIKAL